MMRVMTGNTLDQPLAGPLLEALLRGSAAPVVA